MNDLKRVEVDITTTAGSYTDEEIREAHKRLDEIVKNIKRNGRLNFGVIQELYEFKQARLYRPINFPTYLSWIEALGYTRYTFDRCLAVYAALTIVLKIPRKKYETIDVYKLFSLIPLMKIKTTKESMLVFLEGAPDNELETLKEMVSERLRLTGETEDGVIDPKQYLSPGFYRIMPLNEKDDREDNPKHNKDMIKVKAIRTAWTFNTDDRNFTVEIK